MSQDSLAVCLETPSMVKFKGETNAAVPRQIKMDMILYPLAQVSMGSLLCLLVCFCTFLPPLLSYLKAGRTFQLFHSSGDNLTGGKTNDCLHLVTPP